MATQIRPLEVQDIPRCAQIMASNPLWQRYQVTAESASQRLAKGFSQSATILVAETEGQVTGFVWYVEKGAFNRSGYIMLIGVDPEAQHLGIGAALMDAAEQILFQLGKDVILLVSDFNLGAQRFYQRRGYQQVGAIPDYVLPGVTEYIYRKTNNSI
jgi:ribosomal protein S18 acetylase RimI-like enzyme